MIIALKHRRPAFCCLLLSALFFDTVWLPAAAPTTAPAAALLADAPPIARVAATTQAEPFVRSARSGAWSDPASWQGNQVPGPGAEVVIRSGDHITFDVQTQKPLRYVHVIGTLKFATDRDTRMDVGLLVVRPGEEEVSPTDAVNIMPPMNVAGPVPVLEVGTAEQPVDADHHAIIRLTYIDGMDPDVCPAIVDAGGRMDIHGAAMPETWLKLKKQAQAGDTAIALNDPATGWRVGDHIVITTTQKLSLFKKGGGIIPTVRSETQTEDRTIAAIDGQMLTLDRPLGYDHVVDGDWRGEVANLSRNVIVESADPAGVRGHTMYHHGSTGSISYAEFRHLGKEGHLGRYPIHFHLCGDTMRGTSVIGVSIWDSANRWLTVHGTNFMVVRDCVGYQSVGHGYFMEDGTEEYNVFDHNLALQAVHGKPLPKQILAFDPNDGAGFWWANSLNTFTRNDAVECDQYGFRMEAGKSPTFDSNHNVRQPDGSKAVVDIRALPFIRFEDNEAHSQRRFALDLGGTRMVDGTDSYKKDAQGKQAGVDRSVTDIGDVGNVGPDFKHPFVVKNFRVWTSQWAFHSFAPDVKIDGLQVYDSNYGIWRSRVEGAEYHNVSMQKMAFEDVFIPFGGGTTYDDTSYKSLKPTDDLPPATIITGVQRTILGDLQVDGTAEDNGTIVRVTVNGHPVQTEDPNFATWTVKFSGADADAATLTSVATDDAGNVEQTPHVLNLGPAVEPTASAAVPAHAVAIMRPAAAAATQPVNANVTGTVTFTQSSDGVSVVADFDGLEPSSRHVFHIHDAPDVSGPDLLTAGKQWKPAAADQHISSTIGVLMADARGHGHFEGIMPGLTITGNGPSILNHTVIIHANGPPKAGPRLAGGIITLDPARTASAG